MNWPPDIQLIEGEQHRNYLRQAYAYAQHFSDDDVTKVGAIIVNPNLEKKDDLDKILSYGANEYSYLLKPTEEQKKDKVWKRDNITHAEVSALYKLLGTYRIDKHLIMYMPWVPCKPCAEEIVSRGLKTIIGHKELIEKTPERWRPSTSDAVDFLKRNKVNLFMYSGKIGGVEHMFDGKLWQP